MPKIEFRGKLIEVSDEGYLVNPKDWSQDLAVELARQEQLELSEAHWEILEVVRDFFRIQRHSPRIRALVAIVREKLGEKKGDTKYLYTLFPSGPSATSTRIAGLPKPEG